MAQTVFITGSTSGIGEASARRFAAAGSRLILNGRNEGKLQSLKAEIEVQYATEILLLTFDVRDRQAAKEAIDGIPPQWQAIDVLVNNAGLVLGTDREHEGDLAEWDIVIDTNIKGLLNITRLVTPLMVKRNSGHIINIGSIAGDAAYAGGSVYCATKAAVKALSDGLRIDLADTPIRVTNIKPGLVETNFSVTRFHGDRARADAVYKGIKPLTGEDVAETIFFVASAPEHVQIAEILIMPTCQASATVVHRNIKQ
ncbi:MAG: SDR family oxidoreductase [Dysgonamonadaceae bacterium]|jgi:NADP-dependent 3-hydroxy acid dehydrogenase YdfG|nr:SDR family oxidoreductase [Dysgonamonadaceae bacterium]